MGMALKWMRAVSPQSLQQTGDSPQVSGAQRVWEPSFWFPVCVHSLEKEHRTSYQLFKEA